MKLLIGTIFSAFIFLLVAQNSHAGSIYLTPPAGTFSDPFSVEIRIESDDYVNVVQVELIYSSDVLEYVRIDGSDGSFPIQAELSEEEGKILFVRGVVGDGVIGSHSIARVYFEPVDDVEGDGSVHIGPESYMIRSSDQKNILSGGWEGVYTISSEKELSDTGRNLPVQRNEQENVDNEVEDLRDESVVEGSIIWHVVGLFLLVGLIGLMIWYKVPQKVINYIKYRG